MRYLVVALALLACPRRAAAEDCYAVASGTKLYAEVMANTEVGATTADVVGWFGHGRPYEPTLRLRFVKLDGDGLVEELDAYVKTGEAKPVACPAPWNRVDLEPVSLTWPDARSAGTVRTRAVAVRRKRAKAEHGRACFASDVPGIDATACADIGRPKVACVAIAKRKPLFARIRPEAQLGETTQRVVAETRARIGDMLAVTIDVELESFDVYVRRKDTTSARCPKPYESEYGVLGAIPPLEALLPDGTDAGFRWMGPGLGDTADPVEVGGRTLACTDHTPITGVSARICRPDIAAP